ncbi:hypothetical protein AB0M20_15330, partial [Actinoplanes sp. NPDC051633]|uniref:SCO7613 C-terminal domain-containing membrane protein n=1 Tax=Actinoplanes sp. NPDC051633 TaxID=3155670 RepID=UPI003429F43A
LTVAAYQFGALAAAAAGLMALNQLMIAETTASIAWAGAALVTVAGIILAGALLSRVTIAGEIAAGLFVAALALASGRVAYVHSAVLMAAAVALIAAAAAVGGGAAGVRGWGARIGALASLGAALLVLGARGVDGPDWQLPVGILLLTAGAFGVLRMREVPAVGVTLAVLTAPAGFGWVWWSAPIAYLLVAAVVLALVVRSVVKPWVALAAVVPAGLAVVIAAPSAAVGAATLGGVVALGVATAIAAWGTNRRADVGGLSLTVALLAAPGAAAWAIAADGWQARTGLAVIGLVVGVVHRIPRAYRGFVVAGALPLLATAPLWAWLNDEPAQIYAAVALLLLATIADRVALIAAVPLGIAAMGELAPGVGGTLISTATGAPAGRTDWADVTAVLLLTAAAVVAARTWRSANPASVKRGGAGRRFGWVAAPGLVLVAPMIAAAAHAARPWVAATALAAGLLGLLGAALSDRPRVVAAAGLLIARAGLAGLLTTYTATMFGFGAVLVAGVVAGLAGRTLPARLIGWPVAAIAGVAFAVTASRAAGQPLRVTALVVLGVAAIALVTGTLLGRPEGRVLQAAAHGAAVVALLLTAGSAGYAAAVCTLWGIALGLRALWPGERRPGERRPGERRPGARRPFLAAAAVAELGAWWLLLSAQQIAVLEAYTIPAAAVALFVGWLALRSKPGLSSWLSFGPALAAALLPTLASVLVDEGQPLRRLLLGAGALVVVLAGSRARLQAPVVTGGAVLALVALHELVLVWDLLPRWIPLAAAGLLLVGLAMTLERRRRDLSRMRAALTRMT